MPKIEWIVDAPYIAGKMAYTKDFQIDIMLQIRLYIDLRKPMEKLPKVANKGGSFSVLSFDNRHLYIVNNGKLEKLKYDSFKPEWSVSLFDKISIGVPNTNDYIFASSGNSIKKISTNDGSELANCSHH